MNACIYANVLDNWQLPVLSQSGGSELDPRSVHDNLSVPLCVCMRFPVPEHQNYTNKYVYRQSQLAVLNWHTRILKLTPVNSRRVVSCPVQPRVWHWDCVFGTVSVAWRELVAGVVASWHNGKIPPWRNAVKNLQCILDIWTIYGFCGTMVKLSSKPSSIS